MLSVGAGRSLSLISHWTRFWRPRRVHLLPIRRHNVGMDGARAAVIVYALSCNFRDADPLGRHDLLARGTAKHGGDDDAPRGSESEFQLKCWRRHKVGSSETGRGAAPLIDRLPATLRLWTKGTQPRSTSSRTCDDSAKLGARERRGRSCSRWPQRDPERDPRLRRPRNHLGKGRSSGRVRVTLWGRPP